MSANEDHLRLLASLETDDCVLWDRGRAGEYGILRGSDYCHRRVCEWTHGPPPSGSHAAHRCGTALCVNPRHLRWATPAENIADKEVHGRVVRGERHHQAKLTAAQAQEIRVSSESVPELMRRFHVGRSQIYRIRAGENWRVP